MRLNRFFTKRENLKSWDIINNSILNLRAEKELTNKEDIENSHVSYIKIHALGDANPTYFAATITSLQEQINPEWQGYKFVGSPFNVYTYNGVEREISFDFKLYANDNDTKNSMLSKLNYLTKYMYYGKYGYISDGEKLNAFMKSTDTS